MSEPIHHAPDAMLASFASGSLPYPFAILVAAHVSVCDECRARFGAHVLIGGIVLEQLPVAAVSGTARDRTFAALDETPVPLSHHQPFDIYPTALAQLLGGAPPRWQPLGFGTKQAILWRGGEGSVRLLSIPAGQAVADHGHRGLELTLVLSGSFSDDRGSFHAGDLEVADDTVVHVPTAGDGLPCICAAATDAPLRFQSLLPRLIQPLLRI
jgi:putative transcriptional regulator